MTDPSPDRAGLPRRRRRTWRIAYIVLSGVAVLATFVASLYANSTGRTIVLFLTAALIGGVAHVLWLTAAAWRLTSAHFFRELVCLARRGRSTVVRSCYVAALLIGLGFLFYHRFGGRDRFTHLLFESGLSLSINDLANLSEWFVAGVIILQNLAVLMLAPAYVATAISEERERRTLELLLTSRLSNLEIVNSKFAARIAHLAGVLLAGLPILSLAQLLGGVDMGVLLANFANTAMNLWTVGSVCIAISVEARSGTVALLSSYAIVGGAAVMFLPLSLYGRTTPFLLAQRDLGADYGFLIAALLVLLLVHLWISFACRHVAAKRLRDYLWMNSEARRLEEADYEEPFSSGFRQQRALLPEEKILKRKKIASLPPIGPDPLAWKEWHVSGRPSTDSGRYCLAIAIACGSLMLPLLFGEVLFSIRPPTGIFQVLVAALAAYLCTSVAFRSAISVVRERQQNTLDALLTLPVDDWEILQAKWWAGAIRNWGWSMLPVALLAMAMFQGEMHPLAMLLMIAAIIVHVAFFASLGLYVSVAARTVLAAQMRIAAMLLGVPVLGLVIYGIYGKNPEGFSFFVLNLCPPLSWYHLGASGRELYELPNGYFGLGLLSILLGLVLYVGAAWLLWVLSRRRFGAERVRGF